MSDSKKDCNIKPQYSLFISAKEKNLKTLEAILYRKMIWRNRYTAEWYNFHIKWLEGKSGARIHGDASVMHGAIDYKRKSLANPTPGARGHTYGDRFKHFRKFHASHFY